MNYTEFKATLKNNEPPNDYSDALVALWYDAQGNWHSAHELVDGKSDSNSKWIHAYLHRKEGDDWNAGYWYRQAGKPFSKLTLEEEHRELVEFMLNQ